MASSIKNLVGKNLQVFATTSNVPSVVSDSSLWGSIILSSYIGGDDALVPYIVFGNGKTHQITGGIGFTSADGTSYSVDEWTTYITSMYHQIMSTSSYISDIISMTTTKIDKNTNDINSLRDDTNALYRDTRETLSQLTTRIDNIDATGNEHLIDEFNTRLQQTSQAVELNASRLTTFYDEFNDSYTYLKNQAAELRVAYDGLYSYVLDSYSYTQSYISVVAGKMIAEFIGGEGPDGVFATKHELEVSHDSLYSVIENTYSYSKSYISQEIDKITSYVQDAYAYNKSYIVQSYNAIYSYVENSYDKLNSSITQTAQSISLAVSDIDNLNTGINGLNTRVTALEVGTGEINAYANSFNIWKSKTGNVDNVKYAYVDSENGIVVTKGKFFGDVEATSFNAVSKDSGFSMKMNNAQIQFWTSSHSDGPVGYFFWNGKSMNLAMFDGDAGESGEYKIINFDYWQSANNTQTVQYAHISRDYVFSAPLSGHNTYNTSLSWDNNITSVLNSNITNIITACNDNTNEITTHYYSTPCIQYINDETIYYTTGIDKYEVKSPNEPDAAHNKYIINDYNFHKDATTYFTGILCSIGEVDGEIRENLSEIQQNFNNFNYDLYPLEFDFIKNGDVTDPGHVILQKSTCIVVPVNYNISSAVGFAKIEDNMFSVTHELHDATEYNIVVNTLLPNGTGHESTLEP